MAILRVLELSKRYGRTLAVDRLSFDVPRGSLFGFLGPNGAGKSTTLAIAIGLVRATSGRVEFFGEPRADIVSVHRRVGALIDMPAFHVHLSARHNLLLSARLFGREAVARIPDIMARVGLAGRERDPVAAYSHGMKQRLALAAALLNDPDLLILDEPTNGLDPEGSDDIWALLRTLVERDGRTVLVSSHLLHEIEHNCTNVAVIRRGRLVACEAVATLLRRAEGTAPAVRVVHATEEAARRGTAALEQRGLATCGVIAASTLTPGAWEYEASLDHGDGAAAQLVRALVEADAAPEAVVPKRLALKDLFMRLTRDEGRGE